MKSNAVVLESPKTDSRIFAHTRWDALSVLAAIFHCVYLFGMFYLFPRVPLWIMLILGFIYSVSISWNINGISHNFIHNPYFRSPLLNQLFSILESITIGFSQVFSCFTGFAGLPAIYLLPGADPVCISKSKAHRVQFFHEIVYAIAWRTRREEFLHRHLQDLG